MRSAFGVLFAKQGIHHIQAVQACILGKLDSKMSGEASCQIDGAYHLVGYTRFNGARPIGYKRCAGTSFINTVFTPWVGTCRTVVSHFLKGFICITVISNRSIIGAKNNHCILFQIQLLQVFYDFTDAPVELYDDISTIAHRRSVTESLMRNSGYMQIVGGKKEKKWMVFILSHPFLWFLHPFIR